MTLRSLWIGSLPPPPADLTNAVADDPLAAALGHRFFFDKRLSANNQVSCAACHIPELYFTDGQPTAHGTQPNKRHTPSIVGAALAPWLLWDGHKDSLWAQAVEPIEAVDEQGSTRLHAVHLIARDEGYRRDYETIFGPLPDLDDYARFPDGGGPVDYLDYRSRWEEMTDDDQEAATRVFVNMGKAIAAYERLINPGPSRFDAYVQALLETDQAGMDNALTDEEIAGLRLFIGAARCTDCHSGPLFSDFDFHNTGVPPTDGRPPDEGRAVGLEKVVADEFNCDSPWSDADSQTCSAKLENSDADTKTLFGAFRTPMLRNVGDTAPFMHAGQFESLDTVLDHYNRAPDAPIGQSELQPLNLTRAELEQLAAFLLALNGPARTLPAELLVPPSESGDR